MQKIDQVVSNKLAKMSFLCALMVVVLHVCAGPDWIGKALAIKGIAVQFFFLAAGYLFAGHMGEEGWYGRQVKSRVKSLLVPYVIWNVAYAFFMVGLSEAARHFGVSWGFATSWDGLCWQNVGILGLNPLGFPSLGLLWFVRCLIVFAVVSPIFLLWTKRRGWILAVLFACVQLAYVILFPEPTEGPWQPNWLGNAWLRAVTYFGAGVWLRFNARGGFHIRRAEAVLVLALGWALLAVDNKVCGWIGTPIAMVGLWYSLSGEAWNKSLTSCAFPIYLLHLFWAWFAASLISILGLKEWFAASAIAWAVKYCIMAGGSILTALLLRWFCPRFAAVVFGGR